MFNPLLVCSQEFMNQLWLLRGTAKHMLFVRIKPQNQLDKIYNQLQLHEAQDGLVPLRNESVDMFSLGPR